MCMKFSFCINLKLLKVIKWKLQLHYCQHERGIYCKLTRHVIDREQGSITMSHGFPFHFWLVVQGHNDALQIECNEFESWMSSCTSVEMKCRLCWIPRNFYQPSVCHITTSALGDGGHCLVFPLAYSFYNHSNQIASWTILVFRFSFF